MRKRFIDAAEPGPDEAPGWLDLDSLARAELSSEAAEHPIEAALSGEGGGWRAAQPGTQTIRLVFDAPQRLRRVQLRFEEHEHSRTQEFVLAWSPASGGPAREIVRQQYAFSPPHTSVERETYAVELDAVGVLEITIRPDVGGGPAIASLARLRLA